MCNATAASRRWRYLMKATLVGTGINDTLQGKMSKSGQMFIWHSLPRVHLHLVQAANVAKHVAYVIFLKISRHNTYIVKIQRTLVVIAKLFTWITYVSWPILKSVPMLNIKEQQKVNLSRMLTGVSKCV